MSRITIDSDQLRSDIEAGRTLTSVAAELWCQPGDGLPRREGAEHNRGLGRVRTTFADMTARKLPGIFCLEGNWDQRLDDRASVLPTLDMLERLRKSTYVHRDVGTQEELYHYLAKWCQAGYRSYSVLYLAFHGVSGAIEVGRGTVTLGDLAEKLNGKAKGRIIYFGSCTVMKDRKVVEHFQKITGAKLVCGYTKKVDWTESAAFDLLLLQSLVSEARIDARVNRLLARYGDLTDILGFSSQPSYERLLK